MLEHLAKEYTAFFDLDVSSELQTVQNVIDNMLTRLEELTSVLQMIKLKNADCSAAVTEDICKYRNEITTLSKKIGTIFEVILKLQNNADLLEKQVEKAEIEFGVDNESKITNFLKPFLKRNKIYSAVGGNGPLSQPDKTNFNSVMGNFEKNT